MGREDGGLKANKLIAGHEGTNMEGGSTKAGARSVPEIDKELLVRGNLLPLT